MRGVAGHPPPPGNPCRPRWKEGVGSPPNYVTFQKNLQKFYERQSRAHVSKKSNNPPLYSRNSSP